MKTILIREQCLKRLEERKIAVETVMDCLQNPDEIILWKKE